MAYNNLNDWATSICDAIREKEGSSDLIPAPDIPERIRGIQSGGWSGIGNSSITEILHTNSSGVSVDGSPLATILTTEAIAETLGYVYIAGYRDTSPYEETINVGNIPNITGFNISASNLYVKGSATISVKYKDSEDYIDIVSDVSDTPDVWGGTNNGGITYNRTYTFDEPTNLLEIKVVMTTVYRCSFTMKFYVSE